MITITPPTPTDQKESSFLNAQSEKIEIELKSHRPENRTRDVSPIAVTSPLLNGLRYGVTLMEKWLAIRPNDHRVRVGGLVAGTVPRARKRRDGE